VAIILTGGHAPLRPAMAVDHWDEHCVRAACDAKKAHPHGEEGGALLLFIFCFCAFLIYFYLLILLYLLYLCFWNVRKGVECGWDYRPNMYGVQGIYTDDTQYCLCGLQSIFETGYFDPQRTTEGACTLHTDFIVSSLHFLLTDFDGVVFSRLRMSKGSVTGKSFGLFRGTGQSGRCAGVGHSCAHRTRVLILKRQESDNEDGQRRRLARDWPVHCRYPKLSACALIGQF
jgi:hypothetical protein